MISLVWLGAPNRRTECGNKRSPTPVDEFNRTAEKYYKYRDQLGARCELILTAHQWNVVQRRRRSRAREKVGEQHRKRCPSFDKPDRHYGVCGNPGFDNNENHAPYAAGKYEAGYQRVRPGKFFRRFQGQPEQQASDSKNERQRSKEVDPLKPGAKGQRANFLWKRDIDFDRNQHHR